MNILLLNYIINACCGRLRYHKMHIYIYIYICSVPILGWGVYHCRCERTQTKQAQYNEFGREAGSRTGFLRGLRQRSSRIVGEQDRQQHSWWRVKVRPWASSEVRG